MHFHSVLSFVLYKLEANKKCQVSLVVKYTHKLVYLAIEVYCIESISRYKLVYLAIDGFCIDRINRGRYNELTQI